MAGTNEDIEYLLGKSPRHFEYRLTEFLARGGYGAVFLATHPVTDEIVVAKLELPNRNSHPTLHIEYLAYTNIEVHYQLPKVATPFSSIVDGRNRIWNCMIMELLGPTLHSLLMGCGRYFSGATTLQLAIQMVNVFQHVHRHGYLYRDIKPDNFMLGRTNEPKWWVVHLIDLGMCTRFRSSRGEYTTRGGVVVGTHRFISISNHSGNKLGPKDDLEGLGYLLISFLKPLPWDKYVRDRSLDEATRKELIHKSKRRTRNADLCAGCPPVLLDYMRTVKKLKHDNWPNYRNLRQSLKDAFCQRYGLTLNDHRFDWDRAHQILPEEDRVPEPEDDSDED